VGVIGIKTDLVFLDHVVYDSTEYRFDFHTRSSIKLTYM
jgi:hypothetical protein